jgi:hypothetical protein
VIKDSKLIQLFIPLFPFLLIYFKRIISFLFRYWHVACYIAAVMGQPFLAYHLTGNNFARLALQGAWIIYLIIGLSTTTSSKEWPIGLQYWLVVYSLAIYFTWGISQRIMYMVIFTLLSLFYYIYIVTLSRREKLGLSASPSQ